VVQLDSYFGVPMPVQIDYMETVAQMTANAGPDTVFLLDSRIPLPGMIEGDALEEHMLRLRNLPPRAPAQRNERTLPDALNVQPATESPALSGGGS
jgi:hypothetical protein